MINKQDFFQGVDGLQLFEQSWYPEKSPKAVMLLVHGLAEHSSRYEHVAEHLTANNVAIETFDLRGHGQSNGERVYVNSFDEYLQDLEIFFKRVKERCSGLPLFIYGHSMGATISTLYVINHDPEIKGLILSGVTVKFGQDVSPALIKIGAILGKYAPRMKTTRLDENSISRDPQIVKQYDEDPLNYRGKIPARTGWELLQAMRRIEQQMNAITQPILIMHGSGDKLSNPESSQELYDGVRSGDKTLKIYAGFYHEIHNDPEQKRVLEDITNWILARL
jgi:acylglycerol lipase